MQKIGCGKLVKVCYKTSVALGRNNIAIRIVTVKFIAKLDAKSLNDCNKVLFVIVQ